jgi:hypothetical protein
MFDETWIARIFPVTLAFFVPALLCMSEVTRGEARVIPVG